MARFRITSRFGTLPIRPSTFAAVQFALLTGLTITALAAVASDSTELYWVAVAGLWLTAVAGWVFEPEVVDGE